jgi:CRISPR system Cascade subunit CasE
MSEAWREGRRLSFDIRVRPVRRLFKAAGVFPKGAEVDAFHIETLRRFPDGRPVDDDDRVKREAVYAQWLAERLDGAASVEKVRLVRFSRHRAARNGNAPEGPDATLHGELVVHQPLAFAERLAKGIGRHTAYGYGMLLLRPAGRA